MSNMQSDIKQEHESTRHIKNLAHLHQHLKKWFIQNAFKGLDDLIIGNKTNNGKNRNQAYIKY